ncbi:uncharacterized protein L969DRAFT_14466 [Mixia osmundae IAM 14324]|uniref:Transmembrane protein n=1 Tax=Mixia osmundae (strain CBS 9802 / IAM 14324 / JCM 22182 / KY 12970) TaxID=764103 RepID=G7E0B1_MIXOS|nr:uncharacterized protein L969DRAFT_14466 [Mixia osmundae IAM 14324]KEI42262.1 hypothetical protein L969DRAFT_14466 [Mixia osmundae IAM 14324]GAA96271.1 hypothetical protein E5Q_02936 [Mixia osmundae IAM 14324]
MSSNRYNLRSAAPASTPRPLSAGSSWSPSPRISRRPQQDADPSGTSMILTGYAFIAGSGLSFVLGLYAVLFSSSNTNTGNPIFDAVGLDEHYKYLVPLLVPVGLVFVILNWGGFKNYRHA